MANISAALRSGEYWKTAAELQFLAAEDRFPPLIAPALEKVLPDGLRRGAIAEIHGVRSSGRTSLCLHIVAAATLRGEVCAVIDLHNNFHPAAAASAGVLLERVVWVRCGGNLEAAMRACDLLLHAGGFGLVWLDVFEASAQSLNKVPISYWHRFRQAVEATPTILLVGVPVPQAKSCAALSLESRLAAVAWTGKEPFTLLRGIKNVVMRGGKLAPARPHLLFLKAA